MLLAFGNHRSGCPLTVDFLVPKKHQNGGDGSVDAPLHVLPNGRVGVPLPTFGFQVNIVKTEK